MVLSNRRNCRFIPAPFRWLYPIGESVLWARHTSKPRPLPVALSNRKNCLFEPAPSRWFYPIGRTAFLSPPPPGGFIQSEELPFWPRPLPAALSNRKNCLREPAPSRWFYPIGGTAVLSPPLSGCLIQSEKAFFGLGTPPAPPPPVGVIYSQELPFWPRPLPVVLSNRRN